MRATLSSNNIVRPSSMVNNSYFSFTCWIIDFNYILYQLASWIIIISEWFDEEVTNDN
jgi:hypothetical protein